MSSLLASSSNHCNFHSAIQPNVSTIYVAIYSLQAPVTSTTTAFSFSMVEADYWASLENSQNYWRKPYSFFTYTGCLYETQNSSIHKFVKYTFIPTTTGYFDLTAYDFLPTNQYDNTRAMMLISLNASQPLPSNFTDSSYPFESPLNICSLNSSDYLVTKEVRNVGLCGGDDYPCFQVNMRGGLGHVTLWKNFRAEAGRAYTFFFAPFTAPAYPWIVFKLDPSNAVQFSGSSTYLKPSGSTYCSSVGYSYAAYSFVATDPIHMVVRILPILLSSALPFSILFLLSSSLHPLSFLSLLCTLHQGCYYETDSYDLSYDVFSGDNTGVPPAGCPTSSSGITRLGWGMGHKTFTIFATPGQTYTIIAHTDTTAAIFDNYVSFVVAGGSFTVGTLPPSSSPQASAVPSGTTAPSPKSSGNISPIFGGDPAGSGGSPLSASSLNVGTIVGIVIAIVVFVIVVSVVAFFLRLRLLSLVSVRSAPPQSVTVVVNNPPPPAMPGTTTSTTQTTTTTTTTTTQQTTYDPNAYPSNPYGQQPAYGQPNYYT